MNNSIPTTNNPVPTTIFETRRLSTGKNYYMSSKTHELLDENSGECWEFNGDDDWQAWTQTVRCKTTGKTEVVLLAGWGYWRFPPAPKVVRTSYFAGDFVATKVVKPKHDCARWRSVTPLMEIGRAANTEEGVNTLRSIMDGFEEDCDRPEFLRR